MRQTIFSVSRWLPLVAFLLVPLLPGTLHALPAELADGFSRTVLADKLANPVDFEIAPDGRIFILDRFGKLWLRKPDGSRTLAADMAVYSDSEAGLLGIALDPAFAENNRLYLYYSPVTPKEQRLSRFTLKGDQLDPDSEIVMLRIPTDRDGPAHDGGNLEFDSRGNLYIGTGDAAEHSDYAAIDETEKNNSAEKSSSNTMDLRGKILRIHPEDDGSYTIPTGNLFTDPAAGLPEIYVMGARNPYKFEIDPKTDWLFWADIGPDAAQASEQGPVGLDELNLTRAAGNYGWPYFIGDNQAYLVRGAKMDPAAPMNTSKWNTGPQGPLPPAQPAWFSKPQPGIALMGGPVYRFDAGFSGSGRLPEAFDQHWIYWDFVTSRIWAVEFDDAGNLVAETQIAKSVTDTVKWPIDIELGPDGALYLLEYTEDPVPYGPISATGKLSRLDFTGAATGLTNLALGKPVTVSSTETGTEQAAKENLDAGNAVDGNDKTRWSSAFSEPQQISVDLGSKQTISKVEILWDPYAWGGSYDIQISDDGANWTTIETVTEGKAGKVDVSFVPVATRHLRIANITRGGDWEWGVAIYELRVFGPATASRYADPLFRDDHYQGSGTCALCHGGLTDGKGKSISINNDWSNSMMANAVRDPYWLAKVAAELKRNPHLEEEISDKCTRCHAPMANDALKKAGEPIRLFGDGFNHPDNKYFDAAMDGVSCTVCHQIADVNLGSPQANSGNFTVEAHANKADRPAYGQYPNPKINPMRNNAGFTPTHAVHISRSALCATCHDLKTPYVDATGNIASGGYESHFPEQMIFTEWRHSIYRDDGSEPKTCQQCHMPKVDGRVRIATNSGNVPLRENFSRHTMTGANTTMLTILRDNAATLGVSAADLDAEIERTREFLKTAATLSITSSRIENGALIATVAVKNNTGHKLPGGYPSRRMFIHFRVEDAEGNVVFESGRVNDDGSIAGNIEDEDNTRFEPHYDVITSSDQVQIYEPIMADTDGVITHTLLRAKTYLKDNRLTPEGFDKKRAPADIAVHGRAADDADFDNGADTITYRVDTGGKSDLVITAELLYQPLSFGHLQDLFTDADLPEVSAFRAMFRRSPNKTELLASARATLGNVSTGGVSSGGGGALALFGLGLLLLPRRRG